MICENKAVYDDKIFDMGAGSFANFRRLYLLKTTESGCFEKIIKSLGKLVLPKKKSFDIMKMYTDSV